MSRPYEVGFMCFGNKKIIFFLSAGFSRNGNERLEWKNIEDRLHKKGRMSLNLFLSSNLF